MYLSLMSPCLSLNFTIKKEMTCWTLLTNLWPVHWTLWPVSDVKHKGEGIVQRPGRGRVPWDVEPLWITFKLLHQHWLWRVWFHCKKTAEKKKIWDSTKLFPLRWSYYLKTIRHNFFNWLLLESFFPFIVAIVFLADKLTLCCHNFAVLRNTRGTQLWSK